MKIYTLGTCAGTEPLPRRQHAACLFEINQKYYWFDAGSGSSRTAFLNNIDTTLVDKIFISHRHRDHTGGLPDILWNIQKIKGMKGLDHPQKVDLFLPEQKIWDCVRSMLNLEWGDLFELNPVVYSEGLVYQDENVTVEARHNHHLEDPGSEHFTSFSFRILAEGKKIVYSGDVRKYTDMGEWLEDCDLLMMETGHHKASEVCAVIRNDKLGVKKILFVHSGREIINDYDGAKARAEAAWGGSISIAEDGDCFII
jgi:ribonuclease BN (tRNA processing enzyme)